MIINVAGKRGNIDLARLFQIGKLRLREQPSSRQEKHGGYCAVVEPTPFDQEVLGFETHQVLALFPYVYPLTSIFLIG